MNNKFDSDQETNDIIENANETIDGSIEGAIDGSFDGTSERVEEANEAEEAFNETVQNASEAEAETIDKAADKTTETTAETTGQAEPAAHGIVDNIKAKSIWLRLFFMLVIALLYSVSRLVVGVVVMLQFFFVLFTGKTNTQLLLVGQSLSTYTYQIICYLTFNTEDRPFPFDTEWPKRE